MIASSHCVSNEAGLGSTQTTGSPITFLKMLFQLSLIMGGLLYLGLLWTKMVSDYTATIAVFSSMKDKPFLKLAPPNNTVLCLHRPGLLAQL